MLLKIYVFFGVTLGKANNEHKSFKIENTEFR